MYLSTNFQRAVRDIGGNGGLVEDANRDLRVRGLRADLEVSIT
jgi:hypothetical protein